MMISSKQILCITGLMLLSFVIYSEQQQATPSNDEYHIKRRRVDGHIPPSYPFFRGSNLGFFVRKRPFASAPEHSVNRRKESESASDNSENILAQALDMNTEQHQQRRFDDYSENPGPMFGR